MAGIKSIFNFKNRKKQTKVKLKWSQAHTERVQMAKTALSQAKPAKAIQILQQLKEPSLDEELNLFSSRLKTIRKENNMGVVTYEQNTTTANRINRAILNVITSLEERLQEEGEIYQKIKVHLNEKYQERLSQKLAGRQPINIKRIPSRQGTSEESSQIFETISVQNIQGELVKTFQAAYGRLLITGAPGTGKTTLLLQLAIKLLETESNTIPIVLNLATWQSDFVTLDKWLLEILPTEMGVNKALAKKVVEEFQLILLLDGFDEVREEDRKSCLEAIGRYGKDADKQYVISSRIEEYKQVTKDAPVNYQLEVAPLTVEQVEQELQRLGHQQPEAMRLLQAIQKDALLRETVQNPFYFNTLQLIFANGVSWSDLDFQADTVEGRQGEIVERFVATELKYQEAYPAEKVRKWLGFLADGMNRHNLVVFELVDLQYSWGEWKKFNYIWAFFIKGLIGTLFLSFGTSLMFGAFSGFIYAIVFAGEAFLKITDSIAVGVGFCLVLTIVGSLIGGMIEVLTQVAD